MRQKLYTAINLAGLALGMAVCLLITLYVIDELSYDKHNENYENIYRIAQIHHPDEAYKVAIVPGRTKPYFKDKFPEVLETTRIFSFTSESRPVVLKSGKVSFNESSFAWVDSSFTDVFTLEIIQGEGKKGLNEKFELLLSESSAKKYFGNENPIGKTIELGGFQDYTVTGVYRDFPRTSHFHFDFLASIYSHEFAMYQEGVWHSANFYTYALMVPNADIQKLTNQVAELTEQEEIGRVGLGFQALKDIHLKSNIRYEIEENGNILYVYTFSVVAVFILLIACINYINLATARAIKRAREVGIRKVLGAVKSQLIKQFYAESILSVVIAIGLGLLLAEFLMPFFNSVSGKALSIDYFSDPTILIAVGVITLFVGIVTGSYPALMLSSYQPVKVLKGKFRSEKSGKFTREGLVIIQFAVSVVLIVSTFIVLDQISFIQNKNLGFSKDHTLVIPVTDSKVRNKILEVRNEIENYSFVNSISAAQFDPTNFPSGWGAYLEGVPEDDILICMATSVDHNYFETLDMNLIAGTNFPPSYFAPASEQTEDEQDPNDWLYVVNETLAKEYGLTPEDAVGKRFGINPNIMGRIIGVVKDFHYTSLHSEIEPVAFYVLKKRFQQLLVKIKNKNIYDNIASIESVFKKFQPDAPFNYKFLDEKVDALYKAEQRTAEIMGGFAVFAIFIACIGLFGLVSFMTEERTKEIGIRKVLGATLQNIVRLLSLDFLKLVGIGFVIGALVSYYFMKSWLEDFAYRIEIGADVFIYSAAAVILISFLTVSYQTVKAALRNPAKSLQYE